jgi:transcriptional regulator with XRE-family HTH domain
MQGERARRRSGIYSDEYQYMLARLRSAREAAGYTQTEAGAAIGRDKTIVSRMESGERRIDPVDLQRFAKLYGKALMWFLPRTVVLSSEPHRGQVSKR